MMATGMWFDKRYSSCCFMGARAKSQCLRHNIDEINAWPVLDCHHVHDPHEWDPSTIDGNVSIHHMRRQNILPFWLLLLLSQLAGGQ